MEASTTRLIHYTLQEYLCTHPELFNNAHSAMTETCLTYLNFQSIKSLLPCPSPESPDTPFLEYSSLHWGSHARVELPDRAESLALQILMGMIITYLPDRF
ncbi:hypothetical protein L873DRAFT_1926413 [Choiromyces venosus 120613-1]|uniref:Uncharacterized protein n=1 Tax=Choiromyces venosus 120613-1 TaxID=1336337 RepID=A0A3N4JCZ3_9PEZI|nr:hypothetical protein L873DRAFT_1926413 [Choiromyces venosus 120613-1]